MPLETAGDSISSSLRTEKKGSLRPCSGAACGCCQHRLHRHRKLRIGVDATVRSRSLSQGTTFTASRLVHGRDLENGLLADIWSLKPLTPLLKKKFLHSVIIWKFCPGTQIHFLLRTFFFLQGLWLARARIEATSSLVQASQAQGDVIHHLLRACNSCQK